MDNRGKIIHFLAPFLFCPTIVGQKQKVLTPKTLTYWKIGFGNWIGKQMPPLNCRIGAKILIEYSSSFLTLESLGQSLQKFNCRFPPPI